PGNLAWLHPRQERVRICLQLETEHPDTPETAGLAATSPTVLVDPRAESGYRKKGDPPAVRVTGSPFLEY
ncbi:hypothetical protein, partial [Frankia sp. EI5c]|uniref:hypothetical protein n=1 Tax=Frankia sp. EI5c TaxID=683316 RepID=UPI001A7E68FA